MLLVFGYIGIVVGFSSVLRDSPDLDNKRNSRHFDFAHRDNILLLPLRPNQFRIDSQFLIWVQIQV